MKFPKLTNLELIKVLESATELFRNKIYYNRDYVEKYIGLNIHSSGFYGQKIGDELVALSRNKTTFDDDKDINIFIQGQVDLIREPINSGTGEITYSGYGYLIVDDVIIFDGRTGKGKGRSDIYVESLTGEFVEQSVEGISVGNSIDHRIEMRSGKPHLIIGDPYQVPSFTSFFITSQPTLIEAGDFIVGGPRTFTWTTNNSSNVTSDDITITDVDAATDLITGSSNDGTETIDIGGTIQLLAGDTQTYRITSSQLQGADISRVFTVVANWAVFSGNNSLTSLTEADVEALANKELRSNFIKTFNLSAGGYKWICYPTDFGTATSFTDTATNFPVAMEPFGGLNYELISITNAFGQTIDYKCHRTLNQLGSNINIAVS